MRSCPYCQASLNRKAVKTTRIDGRKWFEYSNEPFFQKVCRHCDNQLVKKMNQRWYYTFASLSLFAYPVIALSGEILSNEIKISILLFAILGLFISFKQNNDFEYITLEEQENQKIRVAIEYMGGYFKRPIEFSQYCKKYSLSKNELNKMISLGLIEAYAIGEYDFLNDEAPQKET